MALVRDRVLKAFADTYDVKVVTTDNKFFQFTDADGTYLGNAHTVSAACAWMRGLAAGRNLPIPGSKSLCDVS